MSEKMTIDTTTINSKRLALLPAYKKPETYRIDTRMGNGCAGDPPGYPTYFTRCVYTQHGNSPRPGSPCLLLMGRVVDDGKRSREEVKELLHRLWQPLAIDHPRTVAWIESTFCHHRHCYHVPGQEALCWSDDKRLLIWPGGCLGKTPFGTLKDPKLEIELARRHEAFDKWTAEEKEKFVSAVTANNHRISRECEAVAVPENATATLVVRRFYPAFAPTPELMSETLQRTGNWWARLPRRPTPEQCPGESWSAHPVNRPWCQVCGWHEAETKKEAKDVIV